MDYMYAIDQLREDSQIVFMENAIEAFQLQPITEAVSIKELWEKFKTFIKQKVGPLIKKVVQWCNDKINKIKGKSKDIKDDINAIRYAVQKLKKSGIKLSNDKENEDIVFYTYNDKYKDVSLETMFFGLSKLNKDCQKASFDSKVRIAIKDPNREVEAGENVYLKYLQDQLNETKQKMESLNLKDPMDCLDKNTLYKEDGDRVIKDISETVEIAKTQNIPKYNSILSDVTNMYSQMETAVDTASKQFLKYNDTMTKYQKYVIDMGAIIMNDLIMSGEIARSLLQVEYVYVELNSKAIKEYRYYVENIHKKAKSA